MSDQWPSPWEVCLEDFTGEKLLIDPSFIHKILLIHPFPLFLGNIWTYLNLLQGPRCAFPFTQTSLASIGLTWMKWFRNQGYSKFSWLYGEIMRFFHALDDLFCVLFDSSPVVNVGGTMSSIPWWRQRRRTSEMIWLEWCTDSYITAW